MQDILEEEARAYQVTPKDLVGHARTPYLLEPRHRVYWRIRTERGASYPAIARFMNRTHAAIINGVRQYERRHCSDNNNSVGNATKG